MYEIPKLQPDPSRDPVREAARVGIRLLDDAYLAWRAAQFQCHDALIAWRQGTSRDRARAHLAYRAALDREEAAARDFERLSRLAKTA